MTALGTERFIRGFNRFDRQMEDLREPFIAIEQDFHKEEKKVFRRGGYPDKWQPLSSKYAKWKSMNYPGRPIMVLHGDLRAAMTGDFGGIQDLTKVRPVSVIKKQEAEFGAEGPYVLRHHNGTGGMPKRKLVQMTDQMRNRWVKIIHRWAVEKAKAEIEGT